MLSVVIETHNDEDALARTLASLVGAAVEGAVREVIVVDRGSTDQTSRVADHAGCHYLAEGGVDAAIRQSKSDWLLLLEPGSRLGGDWMEAVRFHTARMSEAARFARARGERESLLSRVFGGRRPLADGLVITKRQAAALARPGTGAASIASGLATRRLPAEIVLAPRK